MRCDQCKWWDSYEAKTAKGFITGRCDRAIPFWEATEWDFDLGGGERKLKPEFEGRRFFAQDGSDYNALVYTTPDFFCADFKSV